MTLNDVKIGTRLAAMIGILLLATLVVAATGWYAVAQEANHSELIHEASDTYETAVDLARGAQVEFKVQVQEWKNLLIRGADREAFDKYSKAFAKAGEDTQAKLTRLKATYVQLNMPTADVDASMAALTALTSTYLQALGPNGFRCPIWEPCQPGFAQGDSCRPQARRQRQRLVDDASER